MEHVLLSSFRPRVGESATISNTNQKTANEMNQNPQSGRCKKPAGENSNKPESRKSQKLDSKKSQNPDNEKSQNPGSETSQKPDSEKSQKPESEKSQNPDTEKSQNPDREKSKKPSSEKSRKPDSEKSQNPDSEKGQGPRSEKSQKPSSQKSQKPENNKSHKPSSEKTQTPDSEESPNKSSWRSQERSSQKSKKPNSQKNHKPSSQKAQKTDSEKGQQSESDDEVEILAHKSSSPLHAVASTYSFKPPLNIKFGLPHKIQAQLSFVTSFNLPVYQEPIVAAFLAEAVAFYGDPLISIEDLKAVSCEEASDSEDMWLPNFVIDAHLNLLSTTCATVTAIKWERFEKSSYKKLGSELMKKGQVLNYNLIFVPGCNEVGNNHWFLLCVYPKIHVKQVVVLDSAAGKFIKPTHQRAIIKMWRALAVACGEPSPHDWCFYVNSPDDMLQQETDYDCGVFLCLFSRALAFADPLVVNADIMNVRRSIIHDLHFQILSPMPSTGVQVGMYYAVDYVTTFYFGRVISVADNFVEVKFLHSKGSTTYDWPRTDDVDRVHCSCIFYGPVLLKGNRPFTISTQREVEKVHLFIRKQHKL